MSRALSPSRRPTPARRKNLRAWARLRVLCGSGLDAMAVAPDAFAVIAQIVPSLAAALTIHEPHGAAQTFFHGETTESARALFKQGGLPTLEARIEVEGQRSALISLLRAPGEGFDEDDRIDLSRIALHLQQALRQRASTAVDHGTDTVEAEALLVCTADARLMHASPAAVQWLAALAAGDPADRRQLPAVCRRLIERLQSAEGGDTPTSAGEVVDMPGARLQLDAQWLGEVGDQVPGRLVGIVLKRLTPRPLRVWRRLNDSSLSPQQLEVAYWLAMGGGRDAVRERVNIGEAVLRDCVKAVYAEFRCSNQAEFLRAF